MSSVFHRSLTSQLPVAVRGEGINLIDGDGKSYIDASGGAAVSCLGHSHPRVVAAVQAQVAKMPFAHTSFFTNEPSEALATALIARAPAGFGAGRVAFSGSGSEAMEIALKLARQYHVERGDTERGHFISRVGSYHGNTLGALAVGGHAGRRAPYGPLLIETTQISPCHAYRYKQENESDVDYGRRSADELEQVILARGPNTIAAFIAEPVSGATLGCVPAVDGYFQRIREICDQYGVLFIADEVMCGMGRTGTMFAMEQEGQEGVCPDIITVAKGLGAGYQPIGAVLASQKVVDAVAAGSGLLSNGHTYMSHAVACAGALAVLEAIEGDDLIANVRARGNQLENLLQAEFGQHAYVGDIRGRGLFWAMELVADRQSKRPFPAGDRLAERIKAKARDNGLICYPAGGTADGTNGDHILLAPPYISTEADIVEIVRRLKVTLDEMLPA